jgi:hypothetical protein
MTGLTDCVEKPGIRGFTAARRVVDQGEFHRRLVVCGLTVCDWMAGSCLALPTIERDRLMAASIVGFPGPLKRFLKRMFRYLTRLSPAWLIAVSACASRDALPGSAASIPVDSAPGVAATAQGDRPGGGRAASAAAPADSLADSVRRPPKPLVPTPDPVRGLYVNRWAAIGSKIWELIDVAKRTEVNALVIDVKDDRGFMLYRSNVPLAKQIGADTVQPMSYRRVQLMLDSMRTYGIYPIARIVVARDPLLAERKTEYAIKKKADPSSSWLDKDGNPWLDPTHPEVWKYAADIAAEAVNLGFSEIQLDYVRFPDEDRIVREGAYAKMNGRFRAQVIRDQLSMVRTLTRPLRVPLTIDVFGLTATDSTDMGIGQRWESFVDQADAVLPMNYPSHFAPGTYKLANPNAKPYATIDHALKDAIRRSAGIAGAGKIIPWYQDFTMGAPRYGEAEVRAQMEAGYANGIRSWMLWNPGSRYTLAALRPEIEPAAAKPDTTR